MLWRLILMSLAAAIMSSCGGGESDPSSPIRLVRLTDELHEPTTIAYANDGSERLFIAERAGAIRVWDGSALLDTPFLDIEDQVSNDFAEKGLLGLVFDPNFSANRRFYVAYTRRGESFGEGGDLVVAEYRVSSADPNKADRAPTRVIMIVDHYGVLGHNGGQLAFGPDGYLYIGTGDADIKDAPARWAENLDVLNGKVLRIGVPDSGDYVIPDDNPFVGRDGRDEIWAYGLRNPWRFSFDRATGDMYIADVGELAVEEVNFRPASSGGGENYGWPTLEGSECAHAGAMPCDDPSFSAPILTHPRSDDSCAVIGGYVYRGPPSIVDGVYLYTDFCGGLIRGARRCNGWVSVELLDARESFETFGFTSFGEGKDARIYVADWEGSLYALEPQADAELPEGLRCAS